MTPTPQENTMSVEVTKADYAARTALKGAGHAG